MSSTGRETCWPVTNPVCCRHLHLVIGPGQRVSEHEAVPDGQPDGDEPAGAIGGEARPRSGTRSTSTARDPYGHAPHSARHWCGRGGAPLKPAPVRGRWPAGGDRSDPGDGGICWEAPRSSCTHGHANRTKGDKPSRTWNSRAWLRHIHADLSGARPPTRSPRQWLRPRVTGEGEAPINILQSTPKGVDAQAVNLLDLTGFVEGLR